MGADHGQRSECTLISSVSLLVAEYTQRGIKCESNEMNMSEPACIGQFAPKTSQRPLRMDDHRGTSSGNKGEVEPGSRCAIREDYIGAGGFTEAFKSG
jgi:hypothetical protein